MLAAASLPRLPGHWRAAGDDARPLGHRCHSQTFTRTLPAGSTHLRTPKGTDLAIPPLPAGILPLLSLGSPRSPLGFKVQLSSQVKTAPLTLWGRGPAQSYWIPQVFCPSAANQAPSESGREDNRQRKGTRERRESRQSWHAPLCNLGVHLKEALGVSSSSPVPNVHCVSSSAVVWGWGDRRGGRVSRGPRALSTHLRLTRYCQTGPPRRPPHSCPSFSRATASLALIPHTSRTRCPAVLGNACAAALSLGQTPRFLGQGSFTVHSKKSKVHLGTAWPPHRSAA